MYEYTLDLIKENNYELLENISNVYAQPEVSDELNIKTYYELKWLQNGKTIKFIKFRI
jgi:tRNA (guanine-N7-)-methyltransferase